MSLRAQNLILTLLTVGVLCLLGLPALAQLTAPAPARPGASAVPGAPGRGGRQGQRGGRGLSLAMLPVNVLDTLTPLKADQKSGISAIEDRTKADLKTADRTNRGAILTKASDEVKALLTPAQMADVQKALPTLSLVSQSRAIPVGALEEVKLTRGQMSKISGLTSATATQLQGLRGPERQAKMQQVGPALKTQIEGVLTASQKSVIAKYEAAHPRRQRGFGGGGPGNGRGGVPNAGGGTASGSRSADGKHRG
jgi:hypothetical protein